MLGDSLGAIPPVKYSMWLAREAYSSHTAWARQGFIRIFEEGRVIGRQPILDRRPADLFRRLDDRAG